MKLFCQSTMFSQLSLLNFHFKRTYEIRSIYVQFIINFYLYGIQWKKEVYLPCIGYRYEALNRVISTKNSLVSEIMLI